jgi:hypothetical protein
MGRVAPVPPGREAAVIVEHLGHDGQPAAGPEQPLDHPQLLGRGVQMLDHLGAGDEVVAPIERAL